MTKINLFAPDPDEVIWYRACLGEGCLTILELPYEKYKNTKYCEACRERLDLDSKRKYMREKRLSRDIRYGDIVEIND